jgi:hypothetical protein
MVRSDKRRQFHQWGKIVLPGQVIDIFLQLAGDGAQHLPEEDRLVIHQGALQASQPEICLGWIASPRRIAPEFIHANGDFKLDFEGFTGDRVGHNVFLGLEWGLRRNAL